MSKLLPTRSCVLAVFLVVALVVGFCLFTDRLQLRAEQLAINSNGLRLRGTLYKSFWTPSAYVVLVHGNRRQGRDHELYRALARLLAREYTVLAFDFRGYGESDKPGDYYETFDFSADIAAAVRYASQRFGIAPEQVVLVGHSLGSLQVLNAAQALKSTHVVAIGAGDAGKSVLGSEKKRQNYAQKVFRNTGVKLDSETLAFKMKPLLLEEIFGSCEHNRVLFVHGEYEIESIADIRKHIDDHKSGCSDSQLAIRTVTKADHMFQTERGGRGLRRLARKRMEQFVGINIPVWRLSRIVKDFINSRDGIEAET